MIRRRHVIYVQGYDPRGYAEYFRLFRTEFRSFLKLYRLDGEVGRPELDAERHAAVWPVRTEGRNWQVDTTYEFLRWEDIIRRDFERSSLWAVGAGLTRFVVSLLDGSYWRIFRAHWRFGLFLLYPIAVVIVLLALALAAGAAGALIAERFAAPFPVPAIAGIALGTAALLALFNWTERYTYLVYMFQDAISTVQYGQRRRPDWDERIDLLARRVIEAASAGATENTDEIVIVGHSSGSFLAVDGLARALDLDPGLGRRGPRVALLTVGANLPIIGFQPSAGWFRDRIAQLAAETSIDWVDFQARRDVMNFFPFDPVTGHRLDVPGRANPKVVPVQLREVLTPESFRRLSWRFFKLHFQFLRANERPAAYDYFAIVAGPVPLALRAAAPSAALAAIAGDATAAAAAWERLSTLDTAANAQDVPKRSPPAHEYDNASRIVGAGH